MQVVPPHAIGNFGSFNLNSLQNGTNYILGVRGISENGNIVSDEVTIKFKTLENLILNAPTVIYETHSIKGLLPNELPNEKEYSEYSFIVFSWEPVENAISYRNELRHNGIVISDYSIDDKSWATGGLRYMTPFYIKDTEIPLIQPDEEYEFFIKALCGNTESPVTKVTVKTKLCYPIVELISRTPTSLSLEWSSINKATSYVWKLSKDSDDTILQSGNTENTNITLSGLENQIPYKVTVKAINDNNESDEQTRTFYTGN